MGAETDSSQRRSEMLQGKKLGTGCMRGDADWRQGKCLAHAGGQRLEKIVHWWCILPP